MRQDRLRKISGRLLRTAATGAVAMFALIAIQAVHAQSAGDAASPTTDTLAQTITRTLSAEQAHDLALTTPQLDLTGQPLSVTGGVYQTGNDGSPLVDQKLAYTGGGVSLKIGYRSVGKDVTDADLLDYRTEKDANLPDALSQLLSQRGQSDLNAELGLIGSQGFKLDYKLDTQTNAVANSHGINQSLSLEKDIQASAFSFLHTTGSTAGSSGAGQTTTTDELKYAYAPKSGLSFTGDASTGSGAGSDTSQWRLGVAEKSSRLNFGGEFWSSDSDQTASAQNTRQSGEKLTLDAQIAPALKITGFYDHEMAASAQTQVKEDYDATIKSTEIHGLEIAAEFARSQQQLAQAAEAKRLVQLTWSLPHFIGVNSAKWVVGLTDRTTEDQGLRRDMMVGFESQVPGSYGVPGLSGATLHLEFAGNEIGAASPGTAGLPRRLRTMHSRLLRLVSAPKAGKWLTWSVAQQTRVGDQGMAMPTMRDYEIKGVVSPALSLTYSNRDQLPQDDGNTRDTKEQKLTATITQPHTAQIVAEFVHGADMSNGVTQQDSFSLGYTGSVAPGQTMSLSLGRNQRAKVGGSPETGTTCKTAFDWRQDAKNLLGFNGALTVWDNQGGTKSDSVDASAHLNFQHVY